VGETCSSTKEGTLRDIKSMAELSTEMQHPGCRSANTEYFTCNDYELLRSKTVTIKTIGFYSTYYIVGVKIKFEGSDRAAFTNVHCGTDFNPSEETKMNYQEIELEEGEHIEKLQ